MDTFARTLTRLMLAGSLVVALAAPLAAQVDAPGRNTAGCQGLPSHAQLVSALKAAQAENNGMLKNQMWGTVVNRDGIVCAVAFTGKARGDQWPGSRVISAQKANTGNEFSLPPGVSGAFPKGLALSSANLYSAVQPGGSLFGLQESNPVDHEVAYRGLAANFGRANDPMVGGRIGGVNVFGGGLPLYNAQHEVVGGLGVSGDTSCADHNVAYRTRHTLQLDYVPAGVSGDATHADTIVYDIAAQAGQMPGVSPSGWGHPACFPPDVTASGTLPATR
jgi:uncharacterized protein GlcG (DUF336 family)